MHNGVGKTVFVGLSGGVDSSVAAARLLARGYTVVGVFIKVWHPEWLVCNWEQERLDAMRVAAHLGIPFLTCDAEAAYRDDVATYFIEEYKAGRTPNPDVMCNQYVKFGRFLDWAMERGADYIATGHYAQRHNGEQGPELHRGVDTAKDQSYFLANLTTNQLANALFPIGDTPKADIRAEAASLGIPVAAKKDSQGICFLGHVDIAEFLAHYTELVPGAVLDTNGTTIGEHHGALTYTLGQRHGFIIKTTDADRSALYVVAKDIAANTITVASTPPTLTTTNIIRLQQPTLRQPLVAGDIISAQFRYRQAPFSVEIITVTENEITLRVQEPTDQPAAGQTCVLYQGTLCVGGGTIA